MAEEFTTLAQLSGELRSIRQLLLSRDELDVERRKVDDERYGAQVRRTDHLLERVDGHGKRINTLEVSWTSFFSENGAFTYVKKKLEVADGKLDANDRQNRAILVLIITTLVGVVWNLLKH